MMIFKDRQSAGELLAKRLKHFSNGRHIIVLGIPRGGVVVASEIAKRLKLPLDIVVTRKIGAPFQKELALGAVDADGNVTWDEKLLEDLRSYTPASQAKINDLREETETQKEEIIRREKLYRGGRGPLDVQDKTVILVDDGIATGATALAAVRYTRKHQRLGSIGSRGTPCEAKIILAVPVASHESLGKISKEVDRIEVLYIPEILGAVGQFYQNFEEISDEKVIQLLKHE